MKLVHRPTLSLLVSLAFVSCATDIVGSRDAVELPAEWRAAGDFPKVLPKDDLPRWWGRFGDPVLCSVIERSLTNIPDIRIARERVREARARRDSQSSTLFPSLDFGASSQSRSSNRDGFGTRSGTSYAAGLDASWEADLFGRRRSQVEVAAANLGVAGETMNAVHAALAAEIATAYTGLRANESRLDVLRRTVVTREQTAQLATWRRQAGEADALESSQALSSLESARAGLPALEQAISQARNRLAVLAGESPGVLDALLSSTSVIPSPPSAVAIGIPADIVRQRPDVRVAGYQMLATAAATKAAKAERFPSLRISGSIGMDTVDRVRLLDPESTAAGLVAGLTAPVFDAGRIRADIEASKALQTQAAETYRRTVIAALAEVEDALTACRRSGERLAGLEKATQLAREADELARQRYESGEIDFLDVLDSQRTLLGLEDSLLATRTDRTTSFIRLYQALGGGWSPASQD